MLHYLVLEEGRAGGRAPSSERAGSAGAPLALPPKKRHVGAAKPRAPAPPTVVVHVRVSAHTSGKARLTASISPECCLNCALYLGSVVLLLSAQLTYSVFIKLRAVQSDVQESQV